MAVLPKDPLLTALRAIIYFLIGVLCFAAFVMIVAAPFVIVFQSEIAAELAQDGKDLAPGMIAAGVALLLGLAGVLIAGIYFLWNLLAVTDTVRDGDPFIPENANRLTRMAWLVVLMELATFALMVPGMWIVNALAEAGEDTIVETDFDGSGLVLILVLFVLARVFRQGAAMREDLEGTV